MLLKDYKIGQRVIAIDRVSGFKNLIGKTGTVCRINKEYASIGVRFDKAFDYGHDCDRTCEMGHGRYGSVDRFKLLNYNPTIINLIKSKGLMN